MVPPIIAAEVAENLACELRALEFGPQRRRADFKLLEAVLKPLQIKLITSLATDTPKLCSKGSLEFWIVPHRCLRISDLKVGAPVLVRFWPSTGSFISSASNMIGFGGFITLFKYVWSLKQPGDERKPEDIIFGLLGRAYLAEVQKAPSKHRELS